MRSIDIRGGLNKVFAPVEPVIALDRALVCLNITAAAISGLIALAELRVRVGGSVDGSIRGAFANGLIAGVNLAAAKMVHDIQKNR